MDAKDKLMVIWSSGEVDVAMKVCLMYTHAARGNQWFDQVVLVIWGPSAKLVSENEEVRLKVIEMQKDGVIVEACIRCAEMYGIAPQLMDLGFDVKPMGLPTTNRLKEGWTQLSF